MKTTMTPDALALRPTQVADILNVSLRTLLRWRQDGCGPAYITQGNGAVVLYPVKHLNRWVEQWEGAK